MRTSLFQHIILLVVVLPWSTSWAGWHGPSVGEAASWAGGPPITVANFNVIGDGFRQTHSYFLEPFKNYFIEINYDGISPLTINTRLTTEPLDTVMAMYDQSGAVMGISDEIPPPGNELSELRFSGMPAGQYFVAIGLEGTTFEADFQATSTSTNSGTVVVEVSTDLFPLLVATRQITLNYNFNGIVHADEPSDPTVNPDDPNGFRAVSNRALDFRGGIPSHPILDRYQLVENGGQNDIVHVGNRNTVDGAGWVFDAAPDGDGIGIQPFWLPDVNQTERQETTVSPAMPLFPNSQLSVLYQISNGGGDFKVAIELVDGADYTEHIQVFTGPDWLASSAGEPNIGTFPASSGGDWGLVDNTGEHSLTITESVIDLGQYAGYNVASLTFKFLSNPNAGLSVLAVNMSPECLLGDANGDGKVNLLDVTPFVQNIAAGVTTCETDLNGDGAANLLDIGPFIEALTGG